MSEKEKIKKIVEKIKPYNPEKIILFGSRAWGKPHCDSDFDLMIIKKTREKYFNRIFKTRKLLYGMNESFDIIVMTPAEIKKSRA
ncbi:MAG: nucleotidyltransferase domain-containing protein [bacterium]